MGSNCAKPCDPMLWRQRYVVFVKQRHSISFAFYLPFHYFFVRVTVMIDTLLLSDNYSPNSNCRGGRGGGHFQFFPVLAHDFTLLVTPPWYLYLTLEVNRNTISILSFIFLHFIYALKGIFISIFPPSVCSKFVLIFDPISASLKVVLMKKR